MMIRLAGYLLLLLSFCTVADDAKEWEATVTLKTIADSPLASPVVLVPKQSIQMAATVWMPERVNWFPQYPDWDMPGATVVPLFMLSPSIERQQEGFMQRGATQNYLITPLSPGELTLTQQTLRVYPDRDRSPELPLPPLAVTVAYPEGAGSFDRFLPATDVKLTQSLSLMQTDGTEKPLDTQAVPALTLKAGEMLKRQVIITAQGIQGALIPVPVADPQASSEETLTTDLTNYDQFLGGTRTLTRYYAPGHMGSVALQPVEIRWYDTVNTTFRTVRLTGFQFKSQIPTAPSQAVSLTLREKIEQLTWQQWIPWLSVLLVIMLLALKFSALVGGLQRTFTRVRKTFTGSEPYAFLRLSAMILFYGTSSSKVSAAYHRWQLLQGEQPALTPQVREWLHATYSNSASRLTGRGRLLKGIWVQRRLNGHHDSLTQNWTVHLPPLSSTETNKPR
ncbi:hypothetical protein BKF00_04545 [Salmonella enterica]|nr:hypothetical protein [Salmonella enterica]